MHKIETNLVYCVSLISNIGLVLMHLSRLCKHHMLDTVRQTESAETQSPCVRQMAAVQFQHKIRGQQIQRVLCFSYLAPQADCHSVKTIDRLEVLANVRLSKSSQWQLLYYYLGF